MKFDTFYPKHPLLKDIIEYYYFQKSDSCKFSTEYYAFPNILLPLNIHQNASCKIKGHQVLVSGVEHENYLMILNGRYEIPLHVQQKGKINKATIVFKPLGLNYFIKTSFNEIAQKPTQIFEEWANTENYFTFLNNFFSENHNDKRISILENFLLLLYKPFSEYSFLSDVIHKLTDFGKEESLEDISKELSVSSRTLNRLFKKHLGISPIGFKKIARFRHSLKNKLLSKEFETLTKIGYESNFYDQAYFIKIYKNLTGQNPKTFFKTIEKLADNRLFFKFIK